MTKLPEEIHPVDIEVGANVRLRRKAMGVSQQDLAKALGVSFQQVQKYERGTNRISASRLYDIAACLGVNVEYFFDGLPANNAPIVTEDEAIVQEFMRHPQIIRIAKGFNNLNDVMARAIIGMIERMGGKGE